jgi:hypothetical protein
MAREQAHPRIVDGQRRMGKEMARPLGCQSGHDPLKFPCTSVSSHINNPSRLKILTTAYLSDVPDTDSEDENDAVQVVANGHGENRRVPGVDRKRKRVRSRSRSLTPPPQLSKTQLDHARDIVR